MYLHAVTNETRSLPENIVTTFFFIVIITIAIVGNIVVILAVFSYRQLREEHANLFLINLSVTDLSSAGVVMISSVVSVSADQWFLGDAWCSIVCGANYCFIIVSMLTLCFISLDRYVAIVHPLRYHAHVTRQRVLALTGYTWVQGGVFALAPMLCQWIDYDYWEATCAINWQRYRSEALKYVIVAFLMCFLFPGLVLFLAYCKVWREVRKIKPLAAPQLRLEAAVRDQANLNSSPESQSVPRRKKYSESAKAVRSLFIVVVAYFVCMTPFSVTKLYKVSITVTAQDQSNVLPGFVNLVATFFQYFSSAVNPLIYGIFRRDFQKAFSYLIWKCVRNKKPRTRVNVTVSSTCRSS